ncbi:MAG: undecaprenyldiphospho-muramoylpentapeptide beta-N-acetylglucosaminyltransferase [Deltaproteobacteria bacterium]|nr:undecaprenyldiphospho-muramoylpentapeptide beta-N-acetylglucosaminyltransferase [Deltaproteobacteria bacterium]
MLRILIAGGGTGGHIFPGLAIAEAFKEKLACDIRFAGTNRPIDQKVIPKAGYRLYTLSVSGLYRVGALKKFQSLLKLPFTFLQSFLILLFFRPHIVIGVGGYASGPILALALLLGKKTIIQEQNAFPGLTNRLLGKWVDLAFVPFEGLERLFKNPVIVGNPLRKAIQDLAEQVDSRSWEKIFISVIGGSQGANSINRTVTGALPDLVKLKDRITLFHQTGENDFEEVREKYEKHKDLSSQVVSFCEDMPDIYSKSHLVICRSGSIINELIAAKRASILIPIAQSSGNHQLENAKIMLSKNCALMIEQKDLTQKSLFKVIEDLVHEPEKIKSMGENAGKLNKGNAAKLIVERILDILPKQR